MNPYLTAAWITLVLFSLMTVFQLALFFGAPFGILAWGGGHRRLPWKLRIGSLLSAGVFVFGGFCVMDKTSILNMPGWGEWTGTVVWVLSGIFALSTVGNITSKSSLEKAVMTPVAVILMLCCLLVAAC